MVLERLAITGASGMVGYHLMDLLERRQVSCVATSRRRPSRLPLGSSWFSWDIRQWKDADELDRLFEGVQALLHLAAALPRKGHTENHLEFFNANVRATLCLGEWAARRAIPMVYLSSASVYAQPDRADIRESDATTSQGLGGYYGFTKLLGEKVLNELAGQGLALCILRPSSLYGYGLSPDKMIPRFLDLAQHGETILLVPPSEDSVDLLHATDASAAALNALEQNAKGTFNIASGKFTSVRELAECCIRTVGRGAVEIGKTEFVRPPFRRFGLNCESAREAFGFAPRISLQEGIRQIWQTIQERVL